jgi:hypothetical protein
MTIVYTILYPENFKCHIGTAYVYLFILQSGLFANERGAFKF